MLSMNNKKKKMISVQNIKMVDKNVRKALMFVYELHFSPEKAVEEVRNKIIFDNM